MSLLFLHRVIKRTTGKGRYTTLEKDYEVQDYLGAAQSEQRLHFWWQPSNIFREQSVASPLPFLPGQFTKFESVTPQPQAHKTGSARRRNDDEDEKEEEEEWDVDEEDEEKEDEEEEDEDDEVKEDEEEEEEVEEDEEEEEEEDEEEEDESRSTSWIRHLSRSFKLFDNLAPSV